MQLPRIPDWEFVRDAFGIALAALVGANIVAYLGVREPHFQLAFVIVWGAVAARHLVARRAAQPAIDTAQHRALAVAYAVVPALVLLWLHERPEWVGATSILLPPPVRWGGAAIGAASIVAPVLGRGGIGRGFRWVADGQAAVSLVLVSANWVVALLAGLGVAALAPTHNSSTR